jgi:tRNA dimethylallyltransferase
MGERLRRVRGAGEILLGYARIRRMDPVLDDPLDRLPLPFLIGPTGVGKSALALELSAQTGCELISLDSMQVYRGMDIGTAKATAAEREAAPHHMLDLVEASERYDVALYLDEVRGLLSELAGEGRSYLFVGGTAFWLRALVQGLFDGPARDPELRARLEEVLAAEGSEALFARLERVDPVTAARLHPNDTRRVVRALEVEELSGKPLSEQQREWGWHGSEGGPKRDARIVGMSAGGEEYEARLRSRVEAMLDAGWVEEALAIRGGCGFGATAGLALGYSEVLALADGELERGACVDEITLRTRQFARKQRTWYRKFDEVRWVDTPPAGELAAIAERLAPELGLA